MHFVETGGHRRIGAYVVSISHTAFSDYETESNFTLLLDIQAAYQDLPYFWELYISKLELVE